MEHKNIFIITHYLVGLSDHKQYGNFKANLDSRYSMIKNSNYWSKLHPVLGSVDIWRNHIERGW